MKLRYFPILGSIFLLVACGSSNTSNPISSTPSAQTSDVGQSPALTSAQPKAIVSKTFELGLYQVKFDVQEYADSSFDLLNPRIVKDGVESPLVTQNPHELCYLASGNDPLSYPQAEKKAVIPFRQEKNTLSAPVEAIQISLSGGLRFTLQPGARETQKEVFCALKEALGGLQATLGNPIWNAPPGNPFDVTVYPLTSPAVLHLGPYEFHVGFIGKNEYVSAEAKVSFTPLHAGFHQPYGKPLNTICQPLWGGDASVASSSYKAAAAPADVYFYYDQYVNGSWEPVDQNISVPSTTFGLSPVMSLATELTAVGCFSQSINVPKILKQFLKLPDYPQLSHAAGSSGSVSEELGLWNSDPWKNLQVAPLIFSFDGKDENGFLYGVDLGKEPRKRNIRLSASSYQFACNGLFGSDGLLIVNDTDTQKRNEGPANAFILDDLLGVDGPNGIYSPENYVLAAQRNLMCLFPRNSLKISKQVNKIDTSHIEISVSITNLQSGKTWLLGKEMQRQVCLGAGFAPAPQIGAPAVDSSPALYFAATGSSADAFPSAAPIAKFYCQSLPSF